MYLVTFVLLCYLFPGFQNFILGSRDHGIVSYSLLWPGARRTCHFPNNRPTPRVTTFGEHCHALGTQRTRPVAAPKSESTAYNMPWREPLLALTTSCSCCAWDPVLVQPRRRSFKDQCWKGPEGFLNSPLLLSPIHILRNSNNSKLTSWILIV